MSTTYEWVVECLTDDDDIADTCAWGTLADAREWQAAMQARGERCALCLVRDYAEGGRMHRQWAYVDDGALPEVFDGGAKVPARYRAEFARC